MRVTASRHVVWRTQGSRHTSGAKAFAHAPPVGGDLGVGLGDGRDACDVLQTQGSSGGNAQGSGWRDGTRRFDGDARNSTRTDSRAAPATLGLHRDVPFPRQARNRYVALDALASATEATKQRCLVAIEKPGAHVKREHRATPRGMSAHRSPQGRPSSLSDFQFRKHWLHWIALRSFRE